MFPDTHNLLVLKPLSRNKSVAKNYPQNQRSLICCQISTSRMLIQEHALFGWIMLSMKLQFLSSSYDRNTRERHTYHTCVAVVYVFESFLVCFAIVVYLCLCCRVQLNVAHFTECVRPVFALPLRTRVYRWGVLSCKLHPFRGHALMPSLFSQRPVFNRTQRTLHS